MGGMTGGSSSTQSTQPYIMSGPSQQAASLAAQAQVNAAQIASEAATQNTQSAIGALMNEYGTALTYANPAINTGNQANAQINYMLGLPAVAPGPAPTAPNIADYTKPVTQADIMQAIQNNLQYGSADGYKATNFEVDPITGQTYTNTATMSGTGENGNIEGASQFIGALGGTSGSLYKNTKTELEQQNAQAQQGANSPYGIAQTAYQQQLNQYNQQQDVYKQYQAKGVATPGDISNIVTNLPGFQFAQQQGINSIQNAASASGQLNSGNLLQGLDQFGQGLSQQYYQNYLGNLSGLAERGLGASNNVQQGASALGSNVAGQYTNLGNAQANAALAAGQAMASSYLLPVQNQEVKMTPYTTSSQTETSSGALGGISQGLGILQGLGGLF